MQRQSTPRTWQAHHAYWALDGDVLVAELGSSRNGLSSDEAAQRLRAHGRNELDQKRRLSWLGLVWNQLRSPLLLLLAFAAVVSGFSREWTDTGIIVSILLATVGIGYWREYQAQTAIAALLARVRTQTTVLRDQKKQLIPLEEVVPGDVVVLSAGSVVPADAIVLEATDCHVCATAGLDRKACWAWGPNSSWSAWFPLRLELACRMLSSDHEVGEVPLWRLATSDEECTSSEEG